MEATWAAAADSIGGLGKLDSLCTGCSTETKRLRAGLGSSVQWINSFVATYCHGITPVVASGLWLTRPANHAIDCRTDPDIGQGGTRTASQPICGRAGRETRASRSDRSSTQPAVSRSAPYSGQPWCRPSPRRWTDGRIGRALAWGRWGTRRRRFAGCRSSTERGCTSNRSRAGSDGRGRGLRCGNGTRRSRIRGKPRGGRGIVPHDR